MALDRILTVKPEDLDICLLASMVAKLEEMVNGHTRCLLDGHGVDKNVPTVGDFASVVSVPVVRVLDDEMATGEWVNVVTKKVPLDPTTSGDQPRSSDHSPLVSAVSGSPELDNGYIQVVKKKDSSDHFVEVSQSAVVSHPQHLVIT